MSLIAWAERATLCPKPLLPAATKIGDLSGSIPGRLTALKEYADFLGTVQGLPNDPYQLAAHARGVHQRIRDMEAIQYKAVELACDIAYALDGTPAKEVRRLPPEKIASLIADGLRGQIDRTSP